MDGSQQLPADYAILHDNAAVRSDVPLSSPVVAHLRAGDAVRVVAVVSSLEDRRLRGRIQEPAGWISILDLDTGYRWARRREDGLGSARFSEEKAQLMEAIRQQDALIGSLRGRIDELQVTNSAAYASFRERVAELEERLLAAHIVPAGEADLYPLGPAPPAPHLAAARAAAADADETASSGEESSDIEEPPLPPGGRTVALRILTGHDADAYLGHPGASVGLPPPAPVPAVESYMPLLPSAVHAQACFAQKQYLPTVYPVNFTRADFVRATGGLTFQPTSIPAYR